MSSDEFSPYNYFTKILNYWWIIFLAAFLGAVLGFSFYLLRPPIYEAKATYFVTIDLNRFPLKSGREDFLQYNEDMAVSTTEGALLSSGVIIDVINQLQTKGISLTSAEMLQSYTIERKHDVWELRYRSHLPEEAQTIVNTWAQIGYQTMLSWQVSGDAPDFVVFQPPTLALIPTQPVAYDRNRVVLAGALIGFVVGIVIANRLSRRQTNQIEQTVSS